jgi:hypothetical protein
VSRASSTRARWPGYPALAEQPLSWSDRRHIVYGDEDGEESGGHLHGLGRAGKSEFPPDWNEDKIAREVVEAARGPSTADEQFDGTWPVTAVRGGVLVGAFVRANGRSRPVSRSRDKV